MFAKLTATFGVVLVLILGMTVITSNQIDPGVTLRVQAAGISNKNTPREMSSAIIRRARALALKNEPLLPGASLGDYPADYTGLIGYAWQLPRTPELSDPQEWTYALRADYAIEIPHYVLQPGDILVNKRGGNFGHALVFAQWSNPAEWDTTREVSDRSVIRARFEQGVPFIAYEVDRFNYPARVQPRQYTLKLVQGAMTVWELERDLRGPYDALRSNQIAGSAELLMPVRMKFTTSPNLVTAQFSIINRGGAPVTLKNIAVVAYGPDALHQGLAGTQTLFPEIKQIVLMPGQTYHYQHALTITQNGTYLALARFQVNDTLQVPAQPAYFQIVAR